MARWEAGGKVSRRTFRFGEVESEAEGRSVRGFRAIPISNFRLVRRQDKVLVFPPPPPPTNREMSGYPGNQHQHEYQNQGQYPPPQGYQPP